MMKLNKKQAISSVIVLAVICLISWIIWGNTALEVNEYEISSEQIPEAFSGFRIAQVSDLHNAEFGEGNEKLITMLSQTDPDIIVITGDLIDSRHTDIEIALNFAAAAVKISPVFFVTGNHESRIDEYAELKIGLENAGVMVLSDEKVRIDLAEEYIYLIGANDPAFQTDYLAHDTDALSGDILNQTVRADKGYTVLLSHRPELFDIYVEAGVDLVFSGHAHGGQFRLPFIGGLVAPNQGLFPEYDAGQFTEENTTMIVSRGVGNSIIPVRFNNRPEIIVIELESTK